MADDERVRAVTAELKTAEKAALTQIADGATRAFPMLKIPSLRLPDSVGPFYVSPVPYAALGAAFDLDLCRTVGRALSTAEALKGSAFGPVVPLGIMRSPFDVGDLFGEDAVAVSRTVAALAETAELPLLGAMSFDGTDRTFDVRALVELLLKPYLDNRSALGGVIVAGGAVNGCRCTDKPFSNVYDKTKPIFVRGYDVGDPVNAVRGGVGLTLDGVRGDVQATLAAVENGNLDERALERVLRPLVARCVDYNEFRKNRLPALEEPDIAALRVRVAEQSTVLLKNDGVLPVDGCVTVEAGKAPRPRAAAVAAKTVAGKNAVVVLPVEEEIDDGQKAFVAAVRQTAETVTVVLCGTHAVDTAAVQNVDAILYAPLYERTVVERTVCGELSPSGRLPFTWGVRKSDYPSEVKRGNRPLYAVESVYIGYRGFEAFGIRPAYPFGYGLDYLDVTVAVGKPDVRDGIVRLPFTARNAAERAGERVITAYAEFPDADVFGVRRRLAGFTRVCFAGKGEASGEIEVRIADLTVFDPSENVFVLPAGKAVFSIDGVSFGAVKIGKKGKVKGYTQKDVSGYFPSETFNPLGVETERLLGVKAYAPTPDRDLQPVAAVSRGAVAAVCKKYRLPRSERPRVRRFLCALGALAVEKITERP